MIAVSNFARKFLPHRLYRTPQSTTLCKLWKLAIVACASAQNCKTVTLDLSSSYVRDTFGHTSMPFILLVASCRASSQIILMAFKSCRVVSIQFFLSLPGFCFAVTSVELASAVCRQEMTKPSQSDFLYSLSQRFFQPFYSPTASFLTVSFHMMPRMCLRNFWCADSSFLFWVSDKGHDSALFTALLTTLMLRVVYCSDAREA